MYQYTKLQTSRRTTLHLWCSTFLIALVVVFGIPSATPTFAVETAQLVKDINTFKDTSESSAPYNALTIGNIAFFVAQDSIHGRELWRTDGTPDGTRLVKDLHPTSSSLPERLTKVGDTLFFVADDGVHGRELWKSDGTVEGTVLVKDVGGGTKNEAALGGLTAVGNQLFFSAFDSAHGQELWKSDGTAAGTKLVKDLWAGPTPKNGFANADATYLHNFNGILLFNADGGVNGKELWRSDGTPEGTVEVKDIRPGVGGSHPDQFGTFGNTVLFRANDGVRGQELWQTDGTAAGTSLIKDICPGATGGLVAAYTSFIQVGALAFFSADDCSTGFELWKSDGTGAGTTLVKDIAPGNTDGHEGPRPASSYPYNLTSFKDKLYFTTQVFGLWVSDGTPTGTTVIKDESDEQGPSYPNDLVRVNDLLFFTASTKSIRELWRSDGTTAGTSRVMAADGLQLDYLFSPLNLASLNHKLLFAAGSRHTGVELWQSDGTEQGTLLLKEINTAEASGVNADGSLPDNLTDVNGTLFFIADDGRSGRELWRTDGTSAGTTLVKDINPRGDARPTYLTNMNGVLYFFAYDGQGSGLWRSDGTSAGTTLVKDFYPPTGQAYLYELKNINGVLFFLAAKDPSAGLWRSDGTTAGTILLKDFFYSVGDLGGSYPSNLTNVDGTLFFTGSTPERRNELWRSDGTSAGTLPLDGVNQLVRGYYYQFIGINKSLFFLASNQQGGMSLWRTDGTTANTVVVKTVTVNSPSTTMRGLTNVNGALAFIAPDTIGAPQVWMSDGTTASTRQLTQLPPTRADFPVGPRELTNVDGTLYFVFDDDTQGGQLWRSDGTQAGTQVVKSYGRKAYSTVPFALSNVRGVLYYGVDDSVNGREVWRSNGTADGTELAADVFAGVGSSVPTKFTASGARLFFEADDGVVGRELWTLQLPMAATYRVFLPAVQKGATDTSGFEDWLQWYPLDRGQAPGNRVINWWANTADPGSKFLRGQSFYAYRTVPTMFPAQRNEQAVRYYHVWPCTEVNSANASDLDPNCKQVRSRWSEVLSTRTSGTSQVYLEQWATGPANAWTVYYKSDAFGGCTKAEVERALVSLRSNPQTKAPIVFMLPNRDQVVLSSDVVCGVTFTDTAATVVLEANYYWIRNERLTTSENGNVIQASNVYYTSNLNNCLADNHADRRTVYVPLPVETCAQTHEEYAMRKVGASEPGQPTAPNPLLTNGLGSWELWGKGYHHGMTYDHNGQRWCDEAIPFEGEAGWETWTTACPETINARPQP